MTYCKLILFVLLMFLHGLVTAQNKSDTIHWWSDFKLTWSDFQGEQENLNDWVAACSSHICYTYTCFGGKFIFAAHSYFNKKLSWVNEEYATSWYLKHEQGHFDIRECYARKLSTILNSLRNINPNSIHQTCQKICDSVAHECDKMQKKYDNETSHARNYKIQNEWSKKIEVMLEKEGDKRCTAQAGF